MRKKNVGYRNLLLPLTFLVIANGQTLVLAQSALWPQFLGPNRNGISPATDVMTQWPAGGPEVLWRAEGGVGMSGISVSDHFAITMWNSSAGQVVVALNPATGTQIWSTPLSRNYENAMGNGPRATPTISGDQVYAFTGDGILACLKLDDGNVVWSENVVAGVGGKAAEYGMACSPLIIGDLVIVTAGGQGSAGGPGFGGCRSRCLHRKNALDGR
jgi:outer membrane protein assembly factor BamB